MFAVRHEVIANAYSCASTDHDSFVADHVVNDCAFFNDAAVPQDGIANDSALGNFDVGRQHGAFNTSSDLTTAGDDGIDGFGAWEMARRRRGCGASSHCIGADIPTVQIDPGRWTEEILVSLEI